MAKNKPSIVDGSKPNAGRIYDYFLGGLHNFEVDRRAAEQVLELVPFTTKAMRLQRWCLQDIARELTVNRGFDVIIDFASGLPTNDHIHHVVPEGTTVIYSDYDEVVVEYAREILGDTPDVYFFEADFRQPRELLNRPEVKEIVDDKRNVALVSWAIAGFVTDEALSHAASVLYDWVGPKGCWAFHTQGAGSDPDDPKVAEVLEIYEQMGKPFYIRSLDDFKSLIHPWQAGEEGFISLLEWHGFDQSIMDDEALTAYGSGGVGYGAYLVK
jgi:hypothetical protein